MLIHLANGTNVCLDGREMAPAAATRDMFLRAGQGDTRLSQTGPLASGVPGELAAFEFAVRQYGRKTLSELILPRRRTGRTRIQSQPRLRQSAEVRGRRHGPFPIGHGGFFFRTVRPCARGTSCA